MPGYDDRGTCLYPFPSDPVQGPWELIRTKGRVLEDDGYLLFKLVSLSAPEGGVGILHQRGIGHLGCEVWLGSKLLRRDNDLKMMGLVDVDGDGGREVAIGKSHYAAVPATSPELLLKAHNGIVSGFQDSIMAMCGPNDSLVLEAEMIFLDQEGNTVGKAPTRPHGEFIWQVDGKLAGRRAAIVTDTSPWQACDVGYQRYIRAISSATEGPAGLKPSYHFAEDTVSKRGVQALDLDRGEEIWFFHTACFPYLYAVYDVTGDDEPEILLGSYGPHNSVNASNLSDVGQGHVILLDSYGRPVWVHTIARAHVGARAGVIRTDPGGDYKIVVAAGCAYADWGLLELLSPEDGSVLASRESGFSYTSLVLADLVGDEGEEIITGTADGRFVLFNTDFEVLYETRPAPSDDYFQIGSCFAECANDIDGDGDIEIIGTWAKMHYADFSRVNVVHTRVDSSEVRLCVLSENLSVLARHPLVPLDHEHIAPWHQPPAYYARVCDLEGDGRNDIIASQGLRIATFTVAGVTRER